MDHGEPHWRTNSSFSPPFSRRWDCSLHSDGLSHGTRRAPFVGSSLSSHGKGSRRNMNPRHYQNHHHSMSDGALSYNGSPSDSFPPPRWTSPAQRYDQREFSTQAGGTRADTSMLLHYNEGRFPGGVSSKSNSFGSASPFSEYGHWASTSKQPIIYPSRNLSGRRSFMSKPVYPLVFRNPVSDGEATEPLDGSIGGKTGHLNSNSTSTNSSLSPDLKFHKILTELQKMEASPEPGASSRREGFRWSNASSYYDFGFEGDAIDIMEHISEKPSRSPYDSARYQKCGICDRFLWQKSPWSSSRIVKSGDLPVTGVLPCGHVFHAECLEETTPKAQVHEPPCAVCLKGDNDEGSALCLEPQLTRKSVQRSHGFNFNTSNHAGGSSSPALNRYQSVPVPRQESSSIKDHFKKRFSFKGKIGRDIFGTKVFGRTAPSHDNRNQLGRFRT
ncbi:putative transcription factor C2H2 family [Dioscorea sansibarensis]